jgi:hypothetical protein
MLRSVGSPERAAASRADPGKSLPKGFWPVAACFWVTARIGTILAGATVDRMANGDFFFDLVDGTPIMRQLIQTASGAPHTS